MPKLKLFIAMSLDGFIADPSDSIDWLEAIEGQGDNGYQSFYNSVDTLIMGRRTYDWIKEHTDRYPYTGKISYVITSQDHDDTQEVKFSKDPVTLIKKLKKGKGKDLWLVGGGVLVDALLKEGLVDEIILTIAPIILGSGIPLFKGSKANLKQTKIQVFNQFTQIHYEVI